MPKAKKSRLSVAEPVSFTSIRVVLSGMQPATLPHLTTDALEMAVGSSGAGMSTGASYPLLSGYEEEAEIHRSIYLIARGLLMEHDKKVARVKRQIAGVRRMMGLSGAQRRKSMQKLLENENVLRGVLEAIGEARHKCKLEMIAQAVHLSHLWNGIELKIHELD